MLLHRLEREGRVQEVDVVHHRDLLEPLARDEVPPRQAVDDEVVARLVAQVEGLDGDPLAIEDVPGAARARDRAEQPQDLRERLRPVLMTATVATVGMLPAAMATGVGSDVKRSLATVVAGGLLVATLMTLFLLPTMYFVIETLAARVAAAGARDTAQLSA